MNTYIYTLEERVANGVEFLNNSAPPEWWDRVDLDTLDLHDGDNCVLGQVFAADAQVTGYFNGYDLITENTDAMWDFDHGFITITSYEDLRNEWVAAIEKIRFEVNA